MDKIHRKHCSRELLEGRISNLPHVRIGFVCGTVYSEHGENESSDYTIFNYLIGIPSKLICFILEPPQGPLSLAYSI